MVEFKVNDYLSLWNDGYKTEIYVKGEKFIQCKFLLINIPIDKITSFADIKSIDEAVENLDRSLEGSTSRTYNIDSETEFWAHCSNLQVWAEHGYDTRLLHRNMAFPLLKRLTEVGDKVAEKVFKEEIAKRMEEGNLNVVLYLLEERYIDFLTEEERDTVLLTSNIKLREKIENQLTKAKKDISSNRSALLVLKELTELGDVLAEKKLLEMIQHNMKIKGVTEYDLLVKEGYYEYLSKKLIFSRLLEKNDAITMMRLNDIIYQRLSDLKPNIESSTREIISIRPVDNDNENKNLNPYNFTIENMKVADLNLSGVGNFTLIQIPDPILKLTNIKSLTVSQNKISKIPDEISNLRFLKELDLSKNSIISLPNSIGNLIKLRDINLNWNMLCNLPESINKLKSLKKLRLNGNKLKKFPKTILELNNLKSLSIGKNYLENLPDLENLTKLEYLDISSNKLKNLPESLLKMRKLKVLRTELNKNNEAMLHKLKKKGVFIDKF